jgi:hypothetical protein
LVAIKSFEIVTKSLSKNSSSFENNIGTSQLHQPQVGVQIFLEAHQDFPKAVQP